MDLLIFYKISSADMDNSNYILKCLEIPLKSFWEKLANFGIISISTCFFLPTDVKREGYCNHIKFHIPRLGIIKN